MPENAQPLVDEIVDKKESDQGEEDADIITLSQVIIAHFLFW